MEERNLERIAFKATRRKIGQHGLTIMPNADWLDVVAVCEDWRRMRTTGEGLLHSAHEPPKSDPSDAPARAADREELEAVRRQVESLKERLKRRDAAKAKTKKAPRS